MKQKVVINERGHNIPSIFLLLGIKDEKHSLPYYLPIPRGRINGFMPFLKALVQSKMPTWVTDSIFSDDCYMKHNS